MEMLTLTMAGQQAVAGDARLCAGSRVRPASPLAAAPAALEITGVYGHHSTAWTVDGAAEKATTFLVFDAKNRPTRQPSELSP